MNRAIRTALFTAIFGFVFAPPAAAVSIYDALQYIDEFDDNGIYVNVGGGGILKTGNSEFGNISGSTYFGYRRERHALLLSGLAELTSAKGEKVADNSLEHARYRFYLTESQSWALEAFGQHERDLFRRIRLRALGGGAVRYELPKLGPVATAIGTGAFVESIRTNKSDTEADSGARYEAVRNSTYLTIAVNPESGGRFGFTGFYQPRVDQLRDYRASVKAFIQGQAAEVVKLEIFAALAYDGSPAGSVKTTDTTSGFKLSLEIKPRKKTETEDTGQAQPEQDKGLVTTPADPQLNAAPVTPVAPIVETPPESPAYPSAETTPVKP